jgi:ribosome-binding protein aMBF1 (putative translation factor)
MRTAKRRAVEAAGFRVGDAAEFLGMSPEERRLLEVRVALADAIRRQRHSSGLSQNALGTRLKTTQPRVAKIERAAADVSLDQMVRALTAAGGEFTLEFAKAAAKASSGKAKL